MTTTAAGGFDVANIPADELADMLLWLVNNLNPIDHMDCAALLMATCDLRTREALALRWQDADLDAKELHVAYTCDELGNPKPVKAKFTVKMPACAADGLRKRRTVQTAYFKRYAKHLIDREGEQATVSLLAPIVSTPEGKPVRPKAFARWWHDRRCDFNMFGWTLSDLRKARMIAAAANSEAGR